MLGYVHNTTKVWRLWDFSSGRTGRAIECSSVVFQEEENAHADEQKMQIADSVFPDAADELHDDLHEEIHEIDETDETNVLSRQDGKSNSLPR